MGYSKQQLIARLQDLQIEFSKYEHPVAMTVEEQVKCLSDVEGEVCKNLFVKDKKHRFYIISALANTKVDMKVLSQRLGLGKGGLRMAPEEAMTEILQVPLGSVTPFALVNESARDVSLLLDHGIKSQKRCIFHPLSNDMSISLHSDGLDKFLKSIGREPSYVDLEANPTVGKDQPPDLAAFVPAGSTVIPDLPEKVASLQISGGSNAASNSKPKDVAEKTKKSSNSNNKAPPNAVKPTSCFTGPERFVEDILGRISAQALSEGKQDSDKQNKEEIEIEFADRLSKYTSSELKNLATIFWNTAYTEGFHAGRASLLR